MFGTWAAAQSLDSAQGGWSPSRKDLTGRIGSMLRRSPSLVSDRGFLNVTNRTFPL